MSLYIDYLPFVGQPIPFVGQPISSVAICEIGEYIRYMGGD